MGVVWRARDEVLHREVAVKEVRAPAALGATDVQRLYVRLEREAWAAARISHRNVVTVYDVVSEDGRPWIVMELIRGIALSDELDAVGPLTPQRAAHIGAEVLAALRGAHEAGVLHRDVKPGNVLLANDGRVVLTDFGIASVEGTSALTMTGELIGSPEFLAPERALGRTPGPASDLWSLGVLLYAAVEGFSPFRQDTPLSTMRAAVDEELPPPRRAGPLAPVIEGLLRKDPAGRLSAAEAADRLRAVAAGGNAPPTVTAPGTPLVPARVTPPPGAYGPAMAASAGAQAPPAMPPPPLVSTTAYGAPHQGRSRRAGAVLAAGAAVLVLALGGLGYALMRNNDSDGDTKGSGGDGSSQGTAQGSGATGSGATDSTGPGDGKDSGGTGSDAAGGSHGSGGSTGGSGGIPATPGYQSVVVSVTVRRPDYRGTCPPPKSEAPALSASFKVNRVPVTVRYRWVMESGEGPDPAWRSLEFRAGSGREKEVSYTPPASEQEGSHEYRIRVDVSSPVKSSSNVAHFSVTCHRATPTVETSPPPETGDETSYPPASAGPPTGAGLTQPR
jgi:hypothetical protein